ncbi:MAG TPA: DUF2000 family protein [Streptosporangiaceae bacterium]|nr:DUF2000 family protein [Streptosporangiaceae bacterium]
MVGDPTKDASLPGDTRRRNRAVVRAAPAAELRFAGLALHGPRNAVDKIFKGATLHP